MPTPWINAAPGSYRPRWRHPMKPPYRFALAVPLMIALLAGCSTQGTPSGPQDPGTTGASPEQAEVASTLAADP